jgi:hypothetical protein
MKVLVKKDSATTVTVDCGEDSGAEARARSLIVEHGAENVTREDGSKLDLTVVETVKAKKSSKKKPKKRRK